MVAALPLVEEYEIWLPVHEPLLAETCLPSTGEPAIAGSAVFDGADPLGGAVPEPLGGVLPEPLGGVLPELTYAETGQYWCSKSVPLPSDGSVVSEELADTWVEQSA